MGMKTKIAVGAAVAVGIFVPFSIGGDHPRSVWDRLTHIEPQGARQPLTIPVPTAFHGIGSYVRG